ncbi:biotin--acetyl-CoA-carboxylase ligase [Bacillus xiamenensis]|uniref:Bifunctional ligase/repressor BirA n=1 Tax=Bacillus xiamenensis TaxID=1178537 RepID=A0ABT4F5P8_9BACI|nr:MULTISPECIES: biotin--[acetyl-CoA-carboxylase] ligase [Bacillus]MBG9909945.1 biotin--acetyl-CoA-carboxylase ligase [Bacillus xiamenensis]MCY9577385.1 biotin--[acetyl-CoA-carboxylase] ligase [Bacillus xiamenensis]QGX65690.1 biotin--[acetyl-CoA-carboxylase] ligase [Bacillus sp. ms-22]
MRSAIRKRLIELFTASEQDFVSSQQICDELGCSRTAVWKHIEDLRKEGYEVEAVRRKGYRLLRKPDKISEDEILFGLETEVFGRYIYFQEEVASTQLIAHDLVNEGAPHGSLVVSDHQTNGKGRLQRAWYSPNGTGIWMSLILRPEIPLHKAPQMTLLASVAIAEAIAQETGLSPSIKWPNDILLNGKKVVGILTELKAEADQVHAVIIGPGINVNQTAEDFPDELKGIATSLRMELDKKVDRAALIQTIMSTFEKRYDEYRKHGFAPIKQLWESFAVTIGKRIVARTFHEQYIGTALGINDEGILLLETEDGIQKIYSADIEIKST